MIVSLIYWVLNHSRNVVERSAVDEITVKKEFMSCFNWIPAARE